MSRVFWDSNLFIYLIEDFGAISKLTVALAERMLSRDDRLYTSSLTLGEVLTHPVGRGDVALTDMNSSERTRFVSNFLTRDPRKSPFGLAGLLLGILSGGAYLLWKWQPENSPIKGSDAIIMCIVMGSFFTVTLSLYSLVFETAKLPAILALIWLGGLEQEWLLLFLMQGFGLTIGWAPIVGAILILVLLLVPNVRKRLLEIVGRRR